MTEANENKIQEIRKKLLKIPIRHSESPFNRFDSFLDRNGLSGKLSLKYINSASRNNQSYYELRKTQNKSWAFDQAREGIELARDNQHEKAMKKYDSALELDPNCIEALIARGCLYANTQKLKLAVHDLEEALDIDPDHENAKKYLDTIKEKRRMKKQEKRDKEKMVRNGEFLLPY